ncbi:hypothetical protein COCVIDRAFT_34076 [Bipolaris victoriae FI3]|uniref:Uncharacterized protein n=2 Tax=Bipolaris TaxID=33194 RepID=W6Y1I2_COCC2|nr:uncharacterized protein COCCADRAFT_38446 [Bipolaris zeicola 26-R-13]XP_014561043.1 hypothetical protein COCVIDRAFT_34076 [Bipolaris victoriae FI3]EUC31460.1 hypothetical protein COCCADRAFT_38446 [Bipolaris zeicola 26-R-13]
MAKSRVPALGVYQLTSVGLSRRTQPGPSFNIRRQCPALPKPGMTVGFKHYQAFLATQVLPLRRLCCPSLSSLGCMEHPRSELIAQTGWCCNQAAKQHLLSLRLYSKVLLDVQRCCCPPKTAVAPAPVHLCRSPPSSSSSLHTPTPSSSPRAHSFSTVPSDRPVPRRPSTHPTHHHYFQGFLTGSSSGIHRHLVNKRKILVLDVTVATKEVIPPESLAIGYTRACSHDPRRLRSFP